LHDGLLLLYIYDVCVQFCDYNNDDKLLLPTSAIISIRHLLINMVLNAAIRQQKVLLTSFAIAVS